MIKSLSEPIFSEYIGMFHLRSIDFETLTLGTLPPVVQGMFIKENVIPLCNLIKAFFFC